MKFDELRLIGEIFNKGDEKLLKLINQEAAFFIAHVQKLSLRRGIKWDDLAILFER